MLYDVFTYAGSLMNFSTSGVNKEQLKEEFKTVIKEMKLRKDSQLRMLMVFNGINKESLGTCVL
jgi:hypothetical protein